MLASQDVTRRELMTPLPALRKTFLPKKRTEGGVIRRRQPSSAQQKRRRYS